MEITNYYDTLKMLGMCCTCGGTVSDISNYNFFCSYACAANFEIIPEDEKRTT